MEIVSLMRLGDKLLERIKFFEDVQNKVLATDPELALKYVRLSNAVWVFRQKSVRLRGYDQIKIMQYSEGNQLFSRMDRTIHRILANPAMMELICLDEDSARVTEGKTEIALLSQAFDEVIPEIAKSMVSTSGQTQNALK